LKTTFSCFFKKSQSLSGIISNYWILLTLKKKVE
jgi:hypothetical protein